MSTVELLSLTLICVHAWILFIIDFNHRAKSTSLLIGKQRINPLLIDFNYSCRLNNLRIIWAICALTIILWLRERRHGILLAFRIALISATICGWYDLLGDDNVTGHRRKYFILRILLVYLGHVAIFPLSVLARILILKQAFEVILGDDAITIHLVCSLALLVAICLLAAAVWWQGK